MSFEESNEKLRKHIFGIKQLISNPDLTQLLKDTQMLGTRYIDSHNTEARYLGGEYAHKGYSQVTLPMFFFGDATLVERTGNMRLNNPRMNVSNVLIKKHDIQWATSADGKKLAYLKGGYSTFLKYTRPGKSRHKVDHTFTGAMLRNLTSDLVFHRNGGEVTWYVRPPHDRKAAFTNAKREWMGLFRDEIDEIAKMASNSFGLLIYDELKFE